MATAAFEAAIAAAPGDDAPKLVYCDFLEESGSAVGPCLRALLRGGDVAGYDALTLTEAARLRWPRVERIDRLTAEQAALLPVVRDAWLRVGLYAGPADKVRAEEAVRGAYAAAGMPPPDLVLWFDSPRNGAVAAALLCALREMPADQVCDQVGAQVRAQVENQVRAQVWAQVGAQVGDQVRAQVRDQVYRCGYGLHDASWLSFYAAFLGFGLAAPDRLMPLMRLAACCGWWWPFERAVVLTAPPAELVMTEGKLVRAAWADGFEVTGSRPEGTP